MNITQTMIDFLDARHNLDLIQAVYEFRIRFKLTDHQVYDLVGQWEQL